MNEFEGWQQLHILPETDIRQLTELAEEVLPPETYMVPGEDGPITVRKYTWAGPLERNGNEARTTVSSVRRFGFRERDLLKAESHMFQSSRDGSSGAQVKTYYVHLDSGLFTVDHRAYTDLASHRADIESAAVPDEAVQRDMWAMEFELGLYTPDESDLPDMQGLLRAGAAHKLEQAFRQREGLRAKIARLPWLHRLFPD